MANGDESTAGTHGDRSDPGLSEYSGNNGKEE
jgi:hypothetical protein